MKPAEIREKATEEIQALGNELVNEYEKLLLQQSSGQLEKTHRLKELRQDIARVKTILRQKLGN